MTESRYKRDLEFNIYKLVEPLIEKLCDLRIGTTNYKKAEEFAIYNIQNHTFLNPIHADVVHSLESIIEKLRINSQTEKADRLENLYKSFLKLKLKNPKGVVDLNVTILQLLLKLSTSPLESVYRVKKHEIQEELIIDKSDSDQENINIVQEEEKSEESKDLSEEDVEVIEEKDKVIVEKIGPPPLNKQTDATEKE